MKYKTYCLLCVIQNSLFGIFLLIVGIIAAYGTYIRIGPGGYVVCSILSAGSCFLWLLTFLWYRRFKENESRDK